MPLHVNAADLDIILQIFARELPNVEIRAFGSRVAELAPGHSADLDLAIVAGNIIAAERMIAVERSLAESGLSFVVDVFDYAKLTKKMQNLIEKTHISLKELNGELKIENK
jgi:hypothetical protein